MSEQDGWIHIPEWEKFQHRDAGRSSTLPWLRLYTELQSKPQWRRLTFHQRGLLVSIWIEYARGKRQLSDNSVTLTRQLGHRVLTRDLKALNDAGFIEVSAGRVAGIDKSRTDKPKSKPKTLVQDEPDDGGERPTLRVVS